MSRLLVVLAFASSSLLLAAGPGGAGKQKDSQQGHASRMIKNAPTEVVVGNEKTVGASPDRSVFPAVADDDPIGNAKTVGGSRHYTEPSENGIGKVGNSKTVGNQ